jgi:hypothetical protein
LTTNKVALDFFNRIDIVSEISGSYLVMQNSVFGPHKFDLGLTDSAYIYTITADYSPYSMLGNPCALPPNLVIVGNKGGFNVAFNSGAGRVSCDTKIGQTWLKGRNTLVVDYFTKDAAITKETSENLAWNLNGDFQYNKTARDEGVFFVPDFAGQTFSPPAVQSLSAIPQQVMVLTAYCPVYINVYDETGNRVGYNSSSGLVETQISSVFWVSNCSIYIMYPSGMYRLIVVGTDDGTFTLQITLQNETGSTAVLMNKTDTITHGASKSWVLSPTIEGIYTVDAVPSLSASISPLSASIRVGEALFFTSIASGGYTPYSYQWFLNGNPVLGATSSSWTFTPATGGIHYVYLEVTDSVGSTTQSENASITAATVVEKIDAAINFDPYMLNLKSNGKWFTCYIELPEGYDVNDIDVSTIMLNGTILVDLEAPTAIGDYNENGVPDLMVKFNRTTLSKLILDLDIMTSNVTLTITGQLTDGTPFEGNAVIAVRMPGDMNMDGKVDITDCILTANYFGSYPGHPRWNPVVDENEDGRINILDLIAIVRNFGKTYP